MLHLAFNRIARFFWCMACLLFQEWASSHAYLVDWLLLRYILDAPAGDLSSGVCQYWLYSTWKSERCCLHAYTQLNAHLKSSQGACCSGIGRVRSHTWCIPNAFACLCLVWPQLSVYGIAKPARGEEQVDYTCLFISSATQNSYKPLILKRSHIS